MFDHEPGYFFVKISKFILLDSGQFFDGLSPFNHRFYFLIQGNP